MACLTAATSSGEVFDVAASASVVFGRIGAVGEMAGRSGIVDGVNAGGLLGTSGPPPPMTPEEGIDDVEVTGRVGTASDFGPGAPFTEACAVGFSALSGLCVDLPDFSEDLVEFSDLFAALPGLSDFPDFSVGFADLSDFSDLFAGLVLVRRLCGVVRRGRRLGLRRGNCVGSRRRTGFAGQEADCSECKYEPNGRHRHGPFCRSVLGGRFRDRCSTCKIKELLSCARRLGNRRISRRKRGIGPSASFDSR